ncbi:MAG: hypothetical protein GKR90_23570 [Pseudomonadales bacterium]|nr:hypothetical protein [Pseudomonadales bacterium]
MKTVYSDEFHSVDWHHITDAPGEVDYHLDYEYSVLGYDTDAGQLDMLMRFRPEGGYCERHSHVAATTTLILTGEQHLEEIQLDGSTQTIVRPTGAYAISPPDAQPHMETGGPEGCTLLLSLKADQGVLFAVYDKAFQRKAVVTIEDFIQRWESR